MAAKQLAGLSGDDREHLEITVKGMLPSATSDERAAFVDAVDAAVQGYRRRSRDETVLSTKAFRDEIQRMRRAVGVLDAGIPGDRDEIFAKIWTASQQQGVNIIRFAANLAKVDAVLAAVEADLDGRQPDRNGQVRRLLFEVALAFAKVFRVRPTTTRNGPFAEIGAVVVGIVEGKSSHRQQRHILEHYRVLKIALGSMLDDAPDPQATAQSED